MTVLKLRTAKALLMVSGTGNPNHQGDYLEYDGVGDSFGSDDSID